MDNLDYIESYFAKQLTPERAREFEIKIEQDPSFAEEVAFYLSALHISKEVSRSDQKQRFKELYRNKTADLLDPEAASSALSPQPDSRPAPVRKMLYVLAAAAMAAGIIFGIYTWTRPASPQQLADNYIRTHLQTLGVTMSSHADSLQTGLRLYNDGKTGEALLLFEKIAAANDSSFEAKKYAGLSALRLKAFDKALGYFKQMERFTDLYANPSLFLQAITLMERNQSGDAVQARELLRKIIDSNQDGKELAKEWLPKMT